MWSEPCGNISDCFLGILDICDFQISEARRLFFLTVSGTPYLESWPPQWQKEVSDDPKKLRKVSDDSRKPRNEVSNPMFDCS